MSKPTLDHVAIAVQSIKESSAIYEALGSVRGMVEVVPDQDVRVQFFDTGQCHVELLEPLSPTGPVGKFIKERGPGLHHICLRVDNIRASLEELKKKGFRLINEQPVVGAGGCLVAFVHPKATGGVLLELKEERVHPHTS